MDNLIPEDRHPDESDASYADRNEAFKLSQDELDEKRWICYRLALQAMQDRSPSPDPRLRFARLIEDMNWYAEEHKV